MQNKTKLKLAQAYRILAKLHMDDHTYTHLSVRSEDKKSFYIYPFGLKNIQNILNGLMLLFGISSISGDLLGFYFINFL